MSLVSDTSSAHEIRINSVVSKVTDASNVDCRTGFPEKKITFLLNAIENAVQQNKGGKVVLVTSSYEQEGVVPICLECAAQVGSRSEKRVLFLDAGTSSYGETAHLRQVSPGSISGYLLGETEAGPLLRVNGTNFYYMAFSKGGEGGNLPFNPHLLSSLIENLKGSFDLILIAAENMLASSLSSALVPFSDGVIVVVEAEATRKPVVDQVVEAIKTNSGNIIGMILNKRRLYIPHALYEFLYKR